MVDNYSNFESILITIPIFELILIALRFSDLHYDAYYGADFA